jgi:hypothetical protein
MTGSSWHISSMVAAMTGSSWHGHHGIGALGADGLAVELTSAALDRRGT